MNMDFTAEVAAAMSQSTDTENRRRQLAAQSPGLGAQLSLPQPVAGCGVGLSDVDMPVIGEGYGHGAPDQPQQRKPFGPPRPSYGDAVLAGIEYPAAASVPVLRHVSNLGDSLLIEPGPDGHAAGTGPVLISPQAPRRSLLGRVLGRLRRK